MRVGDLYPTLVIPSTTAELTRDVSSLSQDEWGDLISTLGDLREAFSHAEDKATEMWATHFPRSER